MTDTITVVSYNRPLTRSARRDLKEYGIRSEDAVNDYGRWTVVELDREPPEDVLDRHELRLEREPDAVYATDSGERVEIFTEAGEVTVNGMEQSISPEDAREHADREGWGRIDDSDEPGVET
jgi:hypothetical protein